MTRSKTNKRQKRAPNTLLEKGILATGLGVAFLMAPLFLGASPIFKPLATGLRIPGWLALGLGLVLLGIHFALKSRADKTSGLPNVVSNKSSAPGGADELNTEAKMMRGCVAFSNGVKVE